MSRTRFAFSLALGSSLAAASPAAGAPQEPGGPRDGEALVLRTRAVESARAGRWAEVVAALGELRRRGAAEEVPGLDLLAARARLALGETAAARRRLEGIVERRPRHVPARTLLARLEAGAGRADGAAEHLLAAARAGGGPLLRELDRAPPAGSGEDGAAVLEGLLADPDFVVELLRESRGFTVGAEPAPTDPFARPSPEPPPPPGDRGGDAGDPELTALEEEIEGLLEDLATRARAGAPASELVASLDRLRDLLDRYGERGTDAALERLAAFRRRAGDLAELVASVRLNVYVHEGNRLLRAMNASLEDGAHDDVLERFARLEDLVDRMQTEDRAAFRRTADALYLRAEPVAARARTLQRIAELDLRVTGTVVPPPAADPATAIVNDRIVRPGDTVKDPATGAPIDDLVVASVDVSSVTFRYADVEFVRRLKPRN